MSNSNNLRTAKKEKNDEFYTMMSDIENEVSLYEDQLKDKIVYCNCDNVFSSNFVTFFRKNFQRFNLKRFVATGLGTITDIFFEKDNEKESYVPFWNGNFLDPNNIHLLKEADIIVTNPPFSLFRTYVNLLIEHNKKFLILGSQNALSYNDIFKLIQENKLWLGYHSGSFKFKISNTEERYQTLGNICWYTNLENTVRNKPMALNSSYSNFQTYDNYSAVEIPKVSLIPYDLKEEAGVPITFLQKYCPKQFKIIGKSDQLAGPIKIDGKIKKNPGRFYLNGKRLYERIVIKKVTPFKQLYVTDQDIEQALLLTKQHMFIDNLRDREQTLRLDCSVRGYLGELLVKRYFEDYDLEVQIPSYEGGSNTDMIINNNGQKLSVEIKTSLLPKNRTIQNLEDLDFKVFVHKDSDTVNSILKDTNYKDVMVQIYFDISKEQREQSDLTNYSIYKNITWLVGLIFKEDWIKWLQQIAKDNKPLQWQYQKRKFWYCPLYLSRYI